MAYYNITTKKIEVFNIFDHYGVKTELANLLNKTNISREDFEKELKNILKFYFWSKAEWEILIRAWCGGNGDEEIKIDIWDQIKWNWDRFVEYVYAMRKK